MRISILPLLILSLSGATQAQVQPGDLLVNSFVDPEVLVHFRPDGTVVQTSGSGTEDFWVGAAILPNGDWVTTHRSPLGVTIFDGTTGAEVVSWKMPPAFATASGDVGVFSDGTIAVVQTNSRVWRFDTAGNVIDKWKVPGSPFGILVDRQDHVWTCDIAKGFLRQTDDQGNQINQFSTGGGAGDVTMAPDGTLFLTLHATGEVVHYAQDGTLLGAFMATGTIQTYGIAVGLDETLWVSSMSSLLLRNFDLDGNLLGSFHRAPAAQPLFLTIPGYPDADLGTNYCGPANFNSTGQSAVISAFGNPQASDNSLQLTASRLPLNVFGYFLNSDVQGFVPFSPGSQGNLCLGGGIGRHVKQVGNSGPAGELVIDVDLGNLPRPGGTHTVVAGETWNFQCWFRDNNGGPTSNFTDGIEIVFE